MATQVHNMYVPTSADMENTIMSYIAQGYSISNRTPDTATMFKKKEFNIIWAVIGFFLCLLPLLIYCIVYAQENDQMVVITIGNAPPPTAIGPASPNAAQPAPAPPANGELRWTDDRRWWWDGADWRDSTTDIPPQARRSDDGFYWWDGEGWRLLTQQPAPAPASPIEDAVVLDDTNPPGDRPV